MSNLTRTPVNPAPWSQNFGFNLGEVVTGESRTLYIAGQTAMSDEGAPQHADDMRGQMALAMDDLNAVLAAADMDLTNVVRLTIMSTDMDATMQNFDVIAARLGQAGAMPPQTMMGVTRLALPELMFEVEAVAVA
ncbi:MAG: RidA family protein [Pseudomonadota bacterium]